MSDTVGRITQLTTAADYVDVPFLYADVTYTAYGHCIACGEECTPTMDPKIMDAMDLLNKQRCKKCGMGIKLDKVIKRLSDGTVKTVVVNK